MHITIPRDLLHTEPPFATVHLDASRDTEHAPADIELRYRAAREHLAQAGAPDRLLVALDDAFAAGTPSEGRAGRFLIAAGGTVLVDRHLSAPPKP